MRSLFCRVLGCSRPHKAKGLCGLHYARDARGAPLDTGVKTPRHVNKGRTCSRPGCPKAAHAAGLCGTHYHQDWRDGPPAATSEVPASALPEVNVAHIPRAAPRPAALPRWRGSCALRCQRTGKACALPTGHRGPHAVGRHRFHLTAEEGQTHFPRAADLDAAAQARFGLAGGDW